MSPPVAARLTLPRPNLGPEPWPDSPTLWPWLILATVAVALLAWAVLRARRRRAVKPSPPPRSDSTDALEAVPAAAPDRVREALVRAFGAGWRARTTEEIDASPVLTERFGGEVAAQVVAYLRACDRAKFSDDPASPSDDLGWWAARFAEEVESGAGTPPTTTTTAR